jgi:hypothetical protein
MKSDEQAIRELVQTWLDASKRGDYGAVQSLMVCRRGWTSRALASFGQRRSR